MRLHYAAYAASPVRLCHVSMPIETTTNAGVTRPGAERVRGAFERGLATARAIAGRAIAGIRPRLGSRGRTMNVIGWTAVIALCLYAGLAAMIYLAQRSLMYFPETIHTTPAAAGLPQAEEISLTASDGVPVTVWSVAPQDGKPVILFFHGNGGALHYRVERFQKLIADGIGLVALEYRGYGGNAGSPSEQGFIADAEAAYDFAAARYPASQL